MPPAPEDGSDTELERLRRQVAEQDQELVELRESLVHWRAQALRGWAARPPEPVRDAELELERELAALRRTLSWRVTAPLRMIRRLTPR